MRPVLCPSVALCALFLFAAPAAAGDDSDLQRRIDRAQPGSTVNVGPGEYVLATALLIRGKRDLTVRFARGVRVLVTDTNSHVVRIEGSTNIKIDGGYFSHRKPLPEYACHGEVINVRDSAKVEIRNADINGSGAVGVGARGVKGLLVEHCLVHQNTFNAFYLDTCSEVEIRANRIVDNANTLQSYRVDGLQMSNNLIRDNGGYWSARDPRPGLP